MHSSGRPSRHIAGALTLALGLPLSGQTVSGQDLSENLILKTNFEVLSPISFVTDDGAAERMIYAAKLRTLSQRIPATACFQHFGIAKDQSAALLQDMAALFERVLHGLEHGNPELGLKAAETDRVVLTGLKAIHDVWGPLQGLINQIATSGSTDDDILLISGTGSALVEITSHVSSTIMGEYSDPTVLLQKDALLLQLAGRLPMMAQHMTRDMCMVLGDLNASTHLRQMVDVRTRFEATLAALRNGMPSMGVEPASDPKLLAALDDAAEFWAGLGPIFDRIEQGELITKDTKTVIFYAMNSLTDRLDRIELLYSEASKMFL